MGGMQIRIAAFISVIAAISLYGDNIASLVLAQADIREDTELGPQFLTPLTNLTVPQGRDIYFTCVVDNLGKYRVAWLKSDTKAILGIHTHMVSLNPRMSVTYNGYNTWKLHISHVHLNDSGIYMCQVNTIPMKSVSAYLSVVVPPDILSNPDSSFDKGDSNEGGTVSLVCKVTGVPAPTVQWRREDGKEIALRGGQREKQTFKTIDGDKLVLNNVYRTDMGGYLCIASNGVPPSVSKRFDVNVNFPPHVKGVNELVGAPLDREVTLECTVEVYPKSLNSWYRLEENLKLHNNNKYNISEVKVNTYTWHVNLTIRYLTKNDFGAYTCLSINALGRSEASIRLQELRLPPTPSATSATNSVTTQKPRRKHNPGYNRGINEVIRSKETLQVNQRKSNDTSFIIPYTETDIYKSVTSVVTSDIHSIDNKFEVLSVTPNSKGHDTPDENQPATPSSRPPEIFFNNSCKDVHANVVFVVKVIIMMHGVLSIKTLRI